MKELVGRLMRAHVDEGLDAVWSSAPITTVGSVCMTIPGGRTEPWLHPRPLALPPVVAVVVCAGGRGWSVSRPSVKVVTEGHDR